MTVVNPYEPSQAEVEHFLTLDVTEQFIYVTEWVLPLLREAEAASHLFKIELYSRMQTGSDIDDLEHIIPLAGDGIARLRRELEPRLAIHAHSPIANVNLGELIVWRYLLLTAISALGGYHDIISVITENSHLPLESLLRLGDILEKIRHGTFSFLFEMFRTSYPPNIAPGDALP